MRRAAAVVMFMCFACGCLYANDKVVNFYGHDGKTLCSFTVELALTPLEQEQGLMFRKSLARNAGMLFVFAGDEIRFFWMKNTFIPLDMVFMDSQFKIADICRSAKPHDETGVVSRAPARYVLEINAGMADRCNLKIGTKAGFTGFSIR